MENIKRPIMLKLLIRIGLPLLLIYGFVLYITYRHNENNTLVQTTGYLIEVVNYRSRDYEQECQKLANTGRVIKNYIEVNYPVDKEKLFEFIKREVEADTNNVGSGVAFYPYKFDKEIDKFAVFIHEYNDELIVSDLTEQYDYLNEEWFIEPIKIRKDYWTEPFWGKITKDVLVINTIPIIIDEEIIGVAFADLSLKKLEYLAKDLIGHGVYPFIISRTGKFVYHPNHEWVMSESIFSLAEKFDMPNFYEIGKKMQAQKTGKEIYFDVSSNEKKWLVYAPIESSGWSFALVIPQKLLYIHVHNLAIVQFIIMFLGLIIILMIMVLVAKSFATPIKKLASLTSEISSGNFEIEEDKQETELKPGFKSIIAKKINIYLYEEDEIAALKRYFFIMLKNLKNYINYLTIVTREKEAVESELKIAKNIQLSMLPSKFPPYPDRKEFDINAGMVPAKDVGGDLYDFFFITENKFCFLIGDVSGKGVTAALFMVRSLTLLKNEALRQKDNVSPEKVFNTVNNALVENNEENLFVTSFIVIVDLKTGIAEYSNAGHNPPMIKRNNEDKFNFLRTKKSFVLGALPDFKYHKESLQLNKDDYFYLYTDGVTEAMDAQNNLYSEKRLEKLLTGMKDLNVDNLISGISKDIEAFVQDTPASDDITMLAFKYNGSN